jgi:hypothetical protein
MYSLALLFVILGLLLSLTLLTGGFEARAEKTM